MAVSNYNALWLDVLRDAGTREIILPFPNLQEAQTLRQKLYRLRHAMNQEDHPYTTLANKVAMRVVYALSDGTQKTYVNNKQSPTPPNLQPYDKKKKLAPILLILKPQDLDYEDLLADAGYKSPDLDL